MNNDHYVADEPQPNVNPSVYNQEEVFKMFYDSLMDAELAFHDGKSIEIIEELFDKASHCIDLFSNTQRREEGRRELNKDRERILKKLRQNISAGQSQQDNAPTGPKGFENSQERLFEKIWEWAYEMAKELDIEVEWDEDLGKMILV